MKAIIVLISTVTLLAASTDVNGVFKGQSPAESDSIHILSGHDLLDIANIWVEKYTNDNPGVALSLAEIHDDKLNEGLLTSGTVALVSKSSLAGLPSENTWRMVVGRDVYVPVMNSENPYREVILQKGISPEEFTRLYKATGDLSWGMLLSNSAQDPVTIYSASDQSSKPYLAEFLQIDQKYITGKETENTNEMLDCIRNDKRAIGFCRLADLLIIEDQKITSGISLIPIDKNGNDAIDFFEDIYNSTSELARGIWIGKYPGSLYSRLYLVTGSQPVGNYELGFLNWIIGNGQQFLPDYGFTELSYSERQSNLNDLQDYSMPLVEVPVHASKARIFFIIIGIIIGVLIFYSLIMMYRTRKLEPETVDARTISVFGENSLNFPDGLFFDKSHTWVFMEKNGQVRTGVDDFLQHITGPITRVKLKKPGDRVRKGESFISLIQQGKQLEIQSPISGIIREHNTGLTETSEAINKAPFSDGWVYVVEPVDWLKEIQSYLMGDKYLEWLKTEFSRLKNFLATGLKPLKKVNPELILQDGGEIADGVLECYGPEAWEEFQSGFLHSERLG